MNLSSEATLAVALADQNGTVAVFADNSSSSSSHTTVFCLVFEESTASDVGSSGGVEDYNLLFEFVAYGVLLNIIGVLGILGNIISMIILSRPQMKSSINYLLIGLARCDTVLIITSIILFGLPIIYPTTGYLFNYYFKVREGCIFSRGSQLFFFFLQYVSERRMLQQYGFIKIRFISKQCFVINHN